MRRTRFKLTPNAVQVAVRSGRVRKSLPAFLGTLLLPGVLLAAPVANITLSAKQPQGIAEGATFRLHPKGDEWGSWYETDDGYTVVKDESTGIWYYGELNQDRKLRPSSKVVGRDRPQDAGLESHIHPAPAARESEGLPANINAAPSLLAPVATAPQLGNIPTLFILVEYNDKSSTYAPSSFANFLSDQLAGYYKEVSYGRVNIQPATESHGSGNDGVVGWLKLDQNHPNPRIITDARNKQIATDAIVAADPYVDYASYDVNNDGFVDSNELAIVIIPAGNETAFGGVSCSPSPSVWGHASGLSSPPTVDGKIVGSFHNGRLGYAEFGEVHGYSDACANPGLPGTAGHQATVGIMAHELGHLIFQLPDLYDTTFASEGVGNFSLMAGGTWAMKPSDIYQGQSPLHLDAWSKLYLGWVDPIVNAAGPVNFPAVGSPVAAAGNVVYLQTTSDPNQYFLFENRGQYGFDAGMSGVMNPFPGVSGTPGGLVVWHVDESVRAASNRFAPNDDVAHKFLDVEEADNVPTMDTVRNDRGRADDFFFQGNNALFDDLSAPNAKLYDGTASGVTLKDISAPAETMTGSFGSGPTSTPTPAVTNTPTPVATSTPTPEATNTPTPVATSTPTPEATNTPTPEATSTPTREVTNTPTPEATNTPIPVVTSTPTPAATETPTATVTVAPTAVTTNTPTVVATLAPRPTVPATPAPTATAAPVPTSTSTPVPTATRIPLPTVSNTPIPTATATNTPLPTVSTPVPTSTPVPSPTATSVPVPTGTPVPSVTPTPSVPNVAQHYDITDFACPGSVSLGDRIELSVTVQNVGSSRSPASYLFVAGDYNGRTVHPRPRQYSPRVSLYPGDTRSKHYSYWPRKRGTIEWHSVLIGGHHDARLQDQVSCVTTVD